MSTTMLISRWCWKFCDLLHMNESAYLDYWSLSNNAQEIMWASLAKFKWLTGSLPYDEIPTQSIRWRDTSIRRPAYKSLLERLGIYVWNAQSGQPQNSIFAGTFFTVFSERELMFMFAICRRASVCLSSVCLSSVCNVRAPYSADWNFRQCFCAI